MLSVPRPDYLKRWLRRTYALRSPVRVSFWMGAVNFTYFVIAAKERFVLRIYVPGWRSQAQVHFEMAQLLHLHGAGIPVSRPIPTKNGGLSAGLELPDGKTRAALFTFAKAPRAERSEVQTCKDAGAAMAKLHAAQGHFKLSPKLPPLDLAGLVDRPLKFLRPYRDSFGKNLPLLLKSAKRIRAELKRLPQSAPFYGLIHGDAHGANMNFDESIGSYRIFDFDLSTRGWRIYDLATFLWDHALNDAKPNTLRRGFKALVGAYSRICPLSRQELRLMPAMLAARHLWFLGFHAQNAQRWGTSIVGERSHTWKIKFMKRWYNGEVKRALFGPKPRKR